VTLSQFGGPQTVLQATPSRCVQISEAGYLGRELMRLNNIFVSSYGEYHSSILVSMKKKFLRLCAVCGGLQARVQGRELAALLASAK
jgi:hypothetical protein